MHILALLAALAATAFAAHGKSEDRETSLTVKTYKHFDCGTHVGQASSHFRNTINDLHTSNREAGEHGGSHAARAVKSINVPLYIHVVTMAKDSSSVTPAMVTAQVAAMNKAYKASNVQFTLQNTTWTVNDTWAVDSDSDADNDMKNALRQGTYGSLNLYFQSDLAGGILGRCTLPTNIGTSPVSRTVYVGDGCNIAAGTMPGGPIYGYDQGKTAVHETGHWLGLLHTFEGYSCSGLGDYIGDTPAESVSTEGCPTNPWKNSCAGSRKGLDPIHNYMDYSTDACYTKFTAGQNARIMSLWPQYRQDM